MRPTTSAPSLARVIPVTVLLGALLSVSVVIPGSAVTLAWGPSRTVDSGQPAQGSPAITRDDTATLVLWESATGSALTSSSTDAGMTWSPARLLGSENYGASSPMLVSTGATTVAAWVPYENTSARIQSATTIDGGVTWGTPALISDYGGVTNTSLTEGGGTVVAAWLKSSRIAVNVSADGGLTWDGPRQLSDLGDANGPVVAVKGDTIVVSWARADGPRLNVEATVSLDAGATWSTVTRLSAAAMTSYEQTAAIDDSGAIVVGWWTQDETAVYSARSIDGGLTWSSAQRNSAPALIAQLPQLQAVDGALIMLWLAFETDQYWAMVSRSTDGGQTWNAPVALSAPADAPILAEIVADGLTVVATWAQPSGDGTLLRSTRSHDGGITWTTPEDLWSDPLTGRASVVVVDGTAAIAAPITGAQTSLEHRVRTLGIAFDVVNPGGPRPELAESGPADVSALAIVALLLVLAGTGIVLRRRPGRMSA